MTDDEVLQAFDGIRVWQPGGQRAVHKPLLILLALGRLARGEAPMVQFSEIDGPLMNLLAQFGPPGAAKNRHYAAFRPAGSVARSSRASPEMRTNELQRAG